MTRGSKNVMMPIATPMNPSIASGHQRSCVNAALNAATIAKIPSMNAYTPNTRMSATPVAPGHKNARIPKMHAASPRIKSAHQFRERTLIMRPCLHGSETAAPPVLRNSPPRARACLRLFSHVKRSNDRRERTLLRSTVTQFCQRALDVFVVLATERCASDGYSHRSLFSNTKAREDRGDDFFVCDVAADVAEGGIGALKITDDEIARFACGERGTRARERTERFVHGVELTRRGEMWAFEVGHLAAPADRGDRRSNAFERRGIEHAADNRREHLEVLGAARSEIGLVAKDDAVAIIGTREQHPRFVIERV